MIVEVINTGSELLLGNTLNTHLCFLGQELFSLGLRIERQVTVPDGEEIRAALVESLGRADIILVTGGLGPTTDDITREITAELLGLPLLEDATSWKAIQDRFSRRGLEMTPRNRRQAQAPEGATVLANPNGTAPGLYIRHVASGEGVTRHIFLLPGPPRELRPMFLNLVVPILKELMPGGGGFQSRRWLVIGMGESKVESVVGEALLAIPGLELGYCARPGEVDVRLTASGAGADQRVRDGLAVVQKILGANIYGLDDEEIEEVVVRLLTARKKTLALAESCTGGNLAHRITNVAGASEIFLGGVVSYSNAAKQNLLGVRAETLAAHGAVSAEVAGEMARGARDRFGADFALAVTGIAGPGGGTAEKPVGTVFIALASASGVTAKKFLNVWDRATFKQVTTMQALEWLRQAASA